MIHYLTLGDLPLKYLRKGIKVYNEDKTKIGITIKDEGHWHVLWSDRGFVGGPSNPSWVYTDISKIENNLFLELVHKDGKILLAYGNESTNDIFVEEPVPKSLCTDCNAINPMSGVDYGYCKLHP